MCLFFVLSSYLITKLLMKERAATGTINIPYFYARRGLRIWPLYFAFLGAVWLIGRYHQPWHVTGGTLLSMSLLSGNWWMIMHEFSGPIMPLWSLSVEEQFYVFWPAIFRRARTANFRWACIALVPFSLVSVWILRANGSTFYSVWWNTLAQVQFFGIGALIALYDYKLPDRISSSIRLLCAAGGLAAWLIGGFCNTASMADRPALLVASYLFAAAGCLLLFRAFFGETRIPAAILNLGKISYGLYVFHVAGLDIAGFAGKYFSLPHISLWTATVGLVLTIVAAQCSFVVLESPFLRFKKRFEIIRARS